MNLTCIVFGHASEPLTIVRVIKTRTVLFHECRRCGEQREVLKGQKFKARKEKRANVREFKRKVS